MKMKARMIAVAMTVVLILAAFPMGVGAAHYHPCNRAQFIRDVTVPDGSHFAPGDTFTKTWRVRNTGSCTWTASDYTLVLTDGNDFGVATSQALTADVPPWSYAELTITGMTAPATPGKYRSYWKLDNGNGQQFGVGWSGGVAIFAEINVVTPPSVTFEFTGANAAAAIWSSGAGALSFPGTAGDSQGFALEDATPKFENGVTATNPGLVAGPNNSYNGFVQGIYPEYSVKKGDRFQTTVGCAFETYYCYVALSLRYQIGSGPVYTLWTFRERYEGKTYSANVRLDRLAGKDVKFILYMSAYGPSQGDTAIWGHPVIVGTGAPTGPGSPGGPSTSGWNTYVDSSSDPFTFMFPPGSTTNLEDKTITLPTGTGVVKTLEISKPGVSASTAVCLTDNTDASGNYDAYRSQKNVDFNIEKFSSGGQEWIVYTAIKPAPTSGGSASCVSLEFKLSASATSTDEAVIKAIADTLDFK
jgi:hypothetical protein